jgi:putative DNA primase/helicase|uniref:ORF21 n=1 Tax=Nitrosopumilaceae spindle-shaped virus TaxID=3065433 RepID=A0AAT9J7I1_9VIRU
MTLIPDDKTITNCDFCLKDDYENCTKGGLCPANPNKPQLKKLILCDHCKNGGDWKAHEECEKNYIANGLKTFCQCPSLSHGRNATTSMEPVSFMDKIKFDSQTLETVKHEHKDRIDIIATRLIDKYNFVTARETDTIYYFNGKIYDSKNCESVIKQETEIQIVECTKSDKAEVIDKIKSRTYESLDHFDKDIESLVVQNGVLSLQTMELSPHTPLNLAKVLLPLNYVKPEFEIDIDDLFNSLKSNLKDTLFWKFLETSFTHEYKADEESMLSVLEMMASTIIRKQIDERSFIMLGNGANGKSVCLDYLSAILGRDNVSHIPLQVLAEDKFASARLDGKHANIFSDLERNELYHTGIIKDLSSGEPVHAQQKNKNGFDLYPFATLVFSCNKFPRVFDQSQGFFRRWILVKWERNFEKDPQKNDNLKKELLEKTEEMDLVFSCLCHVAKKLYDSNRFTNPKDWKTVQKLWNENSDPLNWFVENHIIDSNGSRSKRDTYQFYKKIMFEKGEVPLGMGKFSKAFSEYYEDSKSDHERIWLNIEFREPQQTTLEESDKT